MTGPDTMPQPERDEKKRIQILDSAADLFSRRGFDKTSIRGLASEARVSTSTIYAHFADKDDLLLQSIDRRLSVVEQKVTRIAEHDPDPLQQLKTILSVIHNSLKDDPFLRKILIFDSQVVDHRLHQRADLARNRIKALALQGLRNAVTSGVLDCDDVDALETVLRVSFQGWVLSVENGTDEISEERLTKMLIHLVEGRRK
ncbi:HTH-type transcriptional repressor KstR [Rhodobiaceae bacterium]|nr:HTH-type transcriptional repressor KstR [Rhodobiaceae bacterium]